jgi:hypothetical protein
MSGGFQEEEDEKIWNQAKIWKEIKVNIIQYKLKL